MPPRLEAKRVLVTGAGRGIGKAIAGKFLSEGARLVICDVVDDRLQRTTGELERLGEIHSLPGDVSSVLFCDRLIDFTCEKLGGLDVLINNAGTCVFRPFLEHSEAEWNRILEVNLKSVFLLGQRAARVMVDQGTGGSIVNMASTNGHMAERGLAAYNASKAGVILLTKTMALELASSGIRVNCVSPGLIKTELALEAGGDPELLRNYFSKIPLARAGKPEEVANVFAFLASEEASFMTGEAVIVDGGQTSEE
jgi:3-oxoacyl-[acyl-carrier protein] reductase